MSKFYKFGRVEPKNLAHLKQLSREKHATRLWSLPDATESSWDSRQNGWIGDVKDQGNCGSCWDFSGTGVVEVAYNKAGVFTEKIVLSEEYTLSCGNNGGCDGDDNTTVLDWAKNKGLPTSEDYGPYEAKASRCQYSSGMLLHKIDDWGFADSSDHNGVASVQSIKNAIKYYGCVGAAIAADDAFMNVQPGQVFSGNYSEINHDIMLVGWDDSKGAWLLRNSWGTEWADGGYCWIKYGANEVGTEAVFAIVNNPNPVPPMPPVPPIPPIPPIPPVPPIPPIPPVIPGDLVQDIDLVFADIEARFPDKPVVQILLHVLQYVIDSYAKSLDKK
jgi:C1A family cysteine protease